MAGQPTKYTPAMNKRTLDFLSKGKSIIQLARHLQVNRSTIYQWAKDNKSYSDILETSKEYSQAFWEDELEKMMFNKEVNAPLAKLYFANRFKWTDKGDADTNEDAKDAPSLNISFSVNEPVGEIKVTNAKAK